MTADEKYKKWKVVVGHGMGLRKPNRVSKAREQYRIDLVNARKEYGDWIPFGYNLNLLKKGVKNLRLFHGI